MVVSLNARRIKMAKSRLPGPLGLDYRFSMVLPSRTPGSLGHNDVADPSTLAYLGDTPGPLGFTDAWDASLYLTGSGSKQGRVISPICIHPLVVMPSIPLSWDDVKADLERWEGKVSHLYLDKKGLVTVGIGKMLPNLAAAQKLRFVKRANGVAATAAEVATDFKEVSNQTAGKLSSSYKKYTQLDLPDDVIYDLLKTEVNEFEANLKNYFKGYNTYPASAKRALLDMIYNLGFTKLLKYKKLKKAVESQDWEEASKECHRIGPPEERNNWTRDLFLASVTGGWV
jgi:GH24 family phage-related lysozyme (muramidase)